VVTSCARTRPHAVLMTATGARFEAALVDGKADELQLELASDVRLLLQSCAVRFALHDVVFLVVARPHSTSARGYRLLDARLFTLDRRQTTRLPVAEGIAELSFGYLFEGRPAVARLAVRDVTPDGVQVALPRGAPPLPDTPFPATVSMAGAEVGCLAQPSRVNSGSDVLGLRLSLDQPDVALVDAYLRLRFPALVPRASVELPALQRLLASSGYLALREGTDQALSEWHAMKLPGLSSRDVVYRAEDGTLLGHISITQTYARTWMMHQLATLRGHAESGACREVLYGLISTVPALAQGQDASILGYFNQSKPWHQMSLEPFTRWVGPAGAVITSLDRFEREPDAPPFTPTPEPGVEVQPARANDRLAATALARSQLPGIVADALELHPGRLLTETLAGPQAGRARTALVLRIHGELTGVALCETGPRSASLFNLLNIAHIHVCTGAAAPPLGAQLALLAAVRRFYRERDVADPIVVAPAGTLRAAEEPGTRLAEAMGCIVIRGRALRQWENFLRFQLGRIYSTPASRAT
jgi:hypothetical protein